VLSVVPLGSALDSDDVDSPNLFDEHPLYPTLLLFVDIDLHYQLLLCLGRYQYIDVKPLFFDEGFWREPGQPVISITKQVSMVSRFSLTLCSAHFVSD
jgi:hypothetical protein